MCDYLNVNEYDKLMEYFSYKPLKNDKAAVSKPSNIFAEGVESSLEKDIEDVNSK